MTSKGGITIYEGELTAHRAADGRPGHVRIHVFEKKAARRLDQAELIPEIRSATGMAPPSVARIVASGLIQDEPGALPSFYLVTEWMEGRTIDAYMGEHPNEPMAPSEATRLMAAIARALVLIEQDEQIAWPSGHVRPSTVWMQDLDHVRIDNPWLETAILTCAGSNKKQLSASLAYMAPEQVSGRSVDMRTDVFSCGVLFYELLTAKRLFDATSRSGIVSQIKTGPIVPPSNACPWIDSKMDQLVLWALERTPDKRPDSAAAWEQALQTYLTAVHGDAQQGVRDNSDAAGAISPVGQNPMGIVPAESRNERSKAPDSIDLAMANPEPPDETLSPKRSVKSGQDRAPAPQMEPEASRNISAPDRPDRPDRPQVSSRTAPAPQPRELSATVPADAHPDMVTDITRAAGAASLPSHRRADAQGMGQDGQPRNDDIETFHAETAHAVARNSSVLMAWLPEIVMAVLIAVLVPLAILMAQSHSKQNPGKQNATCAALNLPAAPSPGRQGMQDWVVRAIRPLPHTAYSAPTAPTASMTHTAHTAYSTPTAHTASTAPTASMTHTTYSTSTVHTASTAPPSSRHASTGMALSIQVRRYDQTAVAKLRILTGDGTCIQPSYWIPPHTATSQAIVWVVFPTEPAPGMQLCTPGGPRPLTQWTQSIAAPTAAPRPRP